MNVVDCNSVAARRRSLKHAMPEKPHVIMNVVDCNSVAVKTAKSQRCCKENKRHSVAAIK